MKKATAVIIILFFTISACQESEGDFFSENDEIVFQVEYINHAWGTQHYGFIIAADGSRYTYNNPEDWVFPEDDKISSTSFYDNLDLRCTKEGKVDIDKLNQMKALVLKVDERKLGSAENVMNDAGAENYSFYIKNEINNTYRKITLLNRGDFYIENTDKDAQTIANWLIQLNNGGIFRD